MTVNVDQNSTLKNQRVSDIELVELAGFHAYKEIKKDKVLIVDEKEYLIIDVISDSETGLDAFTVQNTTVVDGEEITETTIVYIGTDKKSAQDLKTDLNLLSDTPPAQLEKGLWYLNEMEKKYGPISSVTGNSLGGGIANFVAVKRPEVKAVTLNPALLLSGVVSKNETYENITNYMSQYDVLTVGIKALGYGHRIPGYHFEINNGIADKKMLGTNHTGYRGSKKFDTKYYEIGQEGQPGFGKIYIDAGSQMLRKQFISHNPIKLSKWIKKRLA